jgi:glucoamylase
VAGETLRVELTAPATVIWSTDGGATAHDLATRDSGLGLFYADLPTARLRPGGKVTFTVRWSVGERDETEPFTLKVEPRPGASQGR